jgi:hypothetical protein
MLASARIRDTMTASETDCRIDNFENTPGEWPREQAPRPRLAMLKYDSSLLKPAAPIALAVVAMLFVGYKQGQWSERWGTFPELTLLTKQMDEIPREFGEWIGRDEEKSSDQIMKMVGAEGELVRTYRNAANEEVKVSMICARLNDIFNHSPDRCYPAAGFTMMGDPTPEVFETSAGPAAFFTTSFRKEEPTGSRDERGYWSWTGNGVWRAPRDPRIEFSKERSGIYKLYVFGSMPTGKNRTSDRDFCKDFIRDFIPVLETALRPAFVESGRIQVGAPAQTPQGQEEPQS